jgi:hypothetical protein
LIQAIARLDVQQARTSRRLLGVVPDVELQAAASTFDVGQVAPAVDAPRPELEREREVPPRHEVAHLAGADRVGECALEDLVRPVGLAHEPVEEEGGERRDREGEEAGPVVQAPLDDEDRDPRGEQEEQLRGELDHQPRREERGDEDELRAHGSACVECKRETDDGRDQELHRHGAPSVPQWRERVA